MYNFNFPHRKEIAMIIGLAFLAVVCILAIAAGCVWGITWLIHHVQFNVK